MPRKTKTGLEHTKSVIRGKVEYVYFNTGTKDERGALVYTPLGRKDAVEFGARYSAAKGARTRGKRLLSAATVPELAAEYQRGKDFRKKSNGTQRTYGIYLNRLAKEFNTAPADGLESSDIYGLMDEMADKPAAVDMLLLAGSQMYAWAKKRKLVRENPFESIDREDWEARQYEPWPEDALEEALADPKLELPVALLYFTAQRIGDCCSIQWTDMEPPKAHEGEVYVRQQKTGKELWIKIHERLAAILATAPRRGEYVLTDPKGKKAKDQTIRGWIKSFGDERGLKLVPHGLRKNAVNALLEAGCSTGETSSISGQSLAMVEHYARLRNNRRMGRAAMAKWERSGNRETSGKTAEKLAEI